MTKTEQQETTSRPSIKTASENGVTRAGRARSTAPRYSPVLAALGRDEVRDRVLTGFRERGGNRDRWRAADRSTMADAITHAEDLLELEHPRWPERKTLAVVRRKLEACVT